MKRLFLSVLIILSITSCGTLSQYQDIDSKQNTAALKIKEKESESVKASLDSIILGNDALAIKFDEQALSLLGTPKNPINVAKLGTVRQQEDFFKKFSADNQKLVSDNQELLKEKADLQSKLEIEAKARESEEWKSWLWKVLFSGVGLVGVGGVIALLVFCPALIPVFLSAAGAICGLVVKVFTAIISEVGSLFTKKA